MNRLLQPHLLAPPPVQQLPPLPLRHMGDGSPLNAGCLGVRDVVIAVIIVRDEALALDVLEARSLWPQGGGGNEETRGHPMVCTVSPH